MPSPIIDALPVAPSRADPASFAARGDAFLGALPAFGVQANALAADLNDKAAAAAGAVVSAQSAAASASSAGQAANTAVDAAGVATSRAGQASSSAAAALASANAAAAVNGIPSVNGKNLQALRVNAAGTGIEWVVTGDALGFVPPQQGGGPGQSNNKINIGAAAGSIKIAVDGVDYGWLPTSSTNPTAAGTQINYAGRNVVAASYTGTHIGNGAQLTGFTQAQINTALGYVPMPSAAFQPGATLEVGQNLDFHAANSANDFDARLGCEAPPGGSGTAKLVVTGNFKVTGQQEALYYLGGGQYLTGFTSAQITGALGFAPLGNSGTQALYCAPHNVGQSGGIPSLQVTGAGGTNSASIAFHRPGAYAMNWGLDENNAMCLGGWSMGSGVYRLISDSAGNLVSLGNVTSTSDIRFKTELQRLTNVAKRLVAIDHGGMRYLDTRTGQHKLGVSAQGVQKHFPDAVVTDEKGHLSVAYGQLALAALIEVTREFAHEIASLKNEVQKLKAN